MGPPRSSQTRAERGGRKSGRGSASGRPAVYRKGGRFEGGLCGTPRLGKLARLIRPGLSPVRSRPQEPGLPESSQAWPPAWLRPPLGETPVADRGERAARRAVRPRRAGEVWPRGVPARPNRAIQVKGLAESNSRLSSRRRQTRLAVVQAGSFRDNPRKPCSDWLLCRGSGASRELLLSRESGQ